MGFNSGFKGLISSYVMQSVCQSSGHLPIISLEWRLIG